MNAGKTTPIIEIRRAVLDYPRTPRVLDGLDLSVGAGEFLAVLGASGSGKSSLLRMIAGLHPFSAGQVWNGARETGYVFQSPILLDWRTVIDNVALPLEIRGSEAREAREARARAVLSRVELLEAATRYPRELSGGMSMRVAIARALVTDPELLLMDEPFAALDELLRFELNEQLLATWQHERQTVVFVTHSVFEAVYLAERIVVIGGGRVCSEVLNPRPYPREARWRGTRGFAETCDQVLAALERAGSPLRPAA